MILLAYSRLMVMKHWCQNHACNQSHHLMNFVGHTTVAYKWYIHNPAPVLENDSHKLLWDFDIQTDHLISTRRPDLIIIIKKKKKKEGKSANYTRPHLEYAIQATHPILSHDAEAWVKVQKLALTFVKGHRHVPYEADLQQLWLLSLTHR